MAGLSVASFTTTCLKCGIDTEDSIQVDKCIKCDIHLCDTCQHQHSLENQNHLFPSQNEIPEHNDDNYIRQDACLRHQDHMIKYICGTHHNLLCSECKSRHKTCRKIENIKKASKGVKTSTGLRDLISDIRKSIELCDVLVDNNRSNLARIDRASTSFTDYLNNGITDIKRTIAKIKSFRRTHSPIRNQAHGETMTHINDDDCSGNKQISMQTLIDCRSQYLNEILEGIKNRLKNQFINMKVMQTENISGVISEIEQNKNSCFLDRKKLQTLLRSNMSEKEVFIEMMKTKAKYFLLKKSLYELCDAWRIISFDISITHTAINPHTVAVNSEMKVVTMFNELLKNSSLVEEKMTQGTNSNNSMIAPVSRISRGTGRDGESLELFEMRYVLSNSFKIRRSRITIRKPFVKCIHLLQNGKIVLADNNTSRLLVYEKWGYMVREIELSGIPHSITIVNDEKLAVTIPAEEKVIFVNVNDYRIQKNEEIFLEDNCFGIACVENKLVVNCENKGMFVCNLTGALEKHYPRMTGEMCIYPGKNGVIFTTKRGSNTIVKFDIRTGKRLYFRFPILRPCGGIMTDITGENIYVACNGSHEIVKCHCESRKKTVLLNREDHTILFPSSVCIDQQTSELIISNNKSDKILVYELAYI